MSITPVTQALSFENLPAANCRALGVDLKNSMQETFQSSVEGLVSYLQSNRTQEVTPIPDDNQAAEYISESDLAQINRGHCNIPLIEEFVPSLPSYSSSELVCIGYAASIALALVLAFFVIFHAMGPLVLLVPLTILGVSLIVELSLYLSHKSKNKKNEELRARLTELAPQRDFSVGIEELRKNSKGNKTYFSKTLTVDGVEDLRVKRFCCVFSQQPLHTSPYRRRSI